jgi:hypothetical protein
MQYELPPLGAVAGVRGKKATFPEVNFPPEPTLSFRVDDPLSSGL